MRYTVVFVGLALCVAGLLWAHRVSLMTDIKD